MRTRNALTRLAAVAPTAEPALGAGEEDRILARIVASDRSPVRRRRPIAIALVAATVVVAGVVAAVATHGNTARQAKTIGGHHPIALTGTRIKLAGYHFRTPAGFAPAAACDGATPAPPGSPETPTQAMRAAASGDNGCIQAFFLISNNGTTPGDNGATPVDVGAYQGYYVPQDSTGESYLYVGLPKASGDGQLIYLQLVAENLSEDQLIAVAESGLPASS